MTEKSWYIYILECKDTSFYTGVTNDIQKRMDAHASGRGSKYVARKGFSRLLHFKECTDKSEACKIEYKIKQLPKWEKIMWFKESQ